MPRYLRPKRPPRIGLGPKQRGRLRLLLVPLIGVLCVALSVATSFVVAQPAGAETALFVSAGGSDTNPCTAVSPCATITHALTLASSGDTIEVAGTIDDAVTVSTTVTIEQWPGQASAKIDAQRRGNVLVIDTGGTLTLNGIIVTGGTSTQSIGAGITNFGIVMVMDSTITGNMADFVNGGAGVTNVGTATITDSTITDNTTTAGIFAAGGLLNFDTVIVSDSTITDNAARSAFDFPKAGGLLNEDLATATITDSTITDNTTTGPGADARGGLHNDGGTVDIGASIVADNSANGSADNCGVTAGSLTSIGYNLTNDATGAACGFTQSTDKVNVDPDLGPLIANGGPTQTQLPAPTSPAVGVIPSPTTLNGVTVCGPGAFDQRGVPRPSPGPNGNCTIGAVEVHPPPPFPQDDDTQQDDNTQ